MAKTVTNLNGGKTPWVMYDPDMTWMELFNRVFQDMTDRLDHKVPDLGYNRGIFRDPDRLVEKMRYELRSVADFLQEQGYYANFYTAAFGDSSMLRMKVTPAWSHNPLRDLFADGSQIADLRLGVFVDLSSGKKPNYAALAPFVGGDNFGMDYTIRGSIPVFHGLYLKQMKSTLADIQTVYDYLDRFSPEEQRDIIIGIKEMSEEHFAYLSKGIVRLEDILDPEWRKNLSETVAKMEAEAKKAKGGIVL
jgi:hypothetical protein